MLAYILGIAKRDNKEIKNQGRFQGLQNGAQGITNRGSLRDSKSGQRYFKSGRDYKSGQRVQISAEHMSRDFRVFAFFLERKL